MEQNHLTLTDIQGEYATLKTDGTREELFIALALLPPGADIGARYLLGENGLQPLTE